MFCGSCGRLLEDGEKYCPVCGALNEEAAKPTTTTPGATPAQGGYSADDAMKSEMAGEAMKWGIMSLVFAMTGCLSFLGFIFSFTAKNKVNNYVRYYGEMEGRVRVGHILGRVGFGFGLGYTIFLVVYALIYGVLLGSMM